MRVAVRVRVRVRVCMPRAWFCVRACAWVRARESVRESVHVRLLARGVERARTCKCPRECVKTCVRESVHARACV